MPDGLTATPATKKAVVLDWNPSTDDVRVKGYTVYVNGVVWKTFGANWTTARVNLLTCGTTYTFAVDAYDGDGNHSPAATATATTLPCVNAS
jgi:hypothetical protein